MENELGIHMHCLSCYKINCKQFNKCNIISCINHCGLKYHECKEEEHLLVCRENIRPCVNSCNGCPFKLNSIQMISHLEVCPASVVHCWINWNRYPLYSKVREQWLPFRQGNPVQIEGDLDIEFAISDQVHLNREMGLRMKRGKSHLPPAKDNIRPIPKERIQSLEEIMHKDLEYVASSIEDNEKDVEIQREIQNFSMNADVFSSGNESDTEIFENFVTYDEVSSDSSTSIATVVSNTDIRKAYFELPHKSTKNGTLKFEIITHGDSGKQLSISDELSQEDIERYREIYSKLKLSYFPLGLNVVIETMPKFQNQYPMYSFSCSKVFRRDQYKWHCQNIHGDIQSSLNGWLLERCPLFQYGCPFSQIRLEPMNQQVLFSKNFSCFHSRFTHTNTNTLFSHDHKKPTENENKRVSGIDSDANDLHEPFHLFDLPREITEYILTYLDSLSLNCVAKTCLTLKELCYDLLDNRGIVISVWVKKIYEKIGACWRQERKVRFFTTACSPMPKWKFTNVPHIGNHVRNCPFLRKTKYTESIKLPMEGLSDTKVKPKVYIRPRAYDPPSDSSTEEEEDNPQEGVEVV